MVRVINGRKKVQRKEREQRGRRIKTKFPKNREGPEKKPLPVFLTNFLMVKKARTVPEPVCRFSSAFHPARLL